MNTLLKELCCHWFILKQILRKKPFKHNLEQHVLCDHVTSDSETLTQHLALMLTTSNKDEAGVSAAKSNWKKKMQHMFISQFVFVPPL